MVELIKFQTACLFMLVAAFNGTVTHPAPIACVDPLEAADGTEFPRRQSRSSSINRYIIWVYPHTYNTCVSTVTE